MSCAETARLFSKGNPENKRKREKSLWPTAFFWSVGRGSLPVALSLDWINATGKGAVLPLEGRKKRVFLAGQRGGPAGPAYLLTRWETTLRPCGLTGEAWACAHSPPDPHSIKKGPLVDFFGQGDAYHSEAFQRATATRQGPSWTFP